MSTQVDYTPDEWNVLVHAPMQASMLIMNADQGGFLERFGLIQEDRDARATVKQFADTANSELVKAAAHQLMEEKSWRPMMESASPQSVTNSLQQARTILLAKATPDEVQEFTYYIYRVADKTAKAAKEQGGELVSPKEAAALQQIATLIDYHA